MEKLAQLEKDLTGDGGNLEDISHLYSLCESRDLVLVAGALRAISRVLLHHRRRCARAAPGTPGLAALQPWLDRQAVTLHGALRKLSAADSAPAQLCAIRLSMEALHNEDREAGQAKGAAERRLQDLVGDLLLVPKWGEHACECLVSEFLGRYADVRHAVLLRLASLCRQLSQEEAARGGGALESSKRRRTEAEGAAARMRASGLSAEDVFSRAFALLKDLPTPEKPQEGEEEEEGGPLAVGLGASGGAAEPAASLLAPGGRPAGFFVRKYAAVFQDAWLQLLGLPVPVKQCPELLQHLPEKVLPGLGQPLMLADFYLRAFNSGDLEVSVLSLSGLLLLLTQYGLGDPETLSSSCSEFYQQLFSLFRAETFALRKRARFQRLAVAALGSGLLPARYAAVFAKKCMRVAVSCSEPGTVMWLVSVAYVLIQKHHSHCKYLLHREGAASAGAADAAAEGAGDPFQSGAAFREALEQVAKSSLWELLLLQRHHLPAVALLAKLFERPFFKPSAKRLDPELFLDQSVDRSYRQALRAGNRQLTKWAGRAEQCPMAFTLQESAAADDLLRLSAALSTSQRKLGAQG